MLIKLWTNFSKRKNSTKQPPSNLTYIEKVVVLKENTSIENPVFILSGIDFDITYAEFEDHYYFVDDIVSISNNLYELHCSQDVLASHKDIIGASSFYIKRASAAHNGQIIDSMYPVKSDISFHTQIPDGYTALNVSIWPQPSLSSGCYVMGIINNSNTAVGSVAYYAFTNAGFRALCDTLMSDVSWTNVQDISNELLKTTFDPFKYITSCQFIPFAASDMGTALSGPLYFGFWNFAVQGCYKITDLTKTLGFSYTLQQHPQIARGEYVLSNYTRYSLMFPPFGQIPLDAALIYNASKIDCSVTIDIATGESVLYIYTSETGRIYCTAGQIGINIPIAQLSTGGIISSIGKGIGDKLGGGIGSQIGQVIGNAVDGIISGLSGFKDDTSTSTMTSRGSMCYLHTMPVLRVGYALMSNEDNTRLGRPLCEVRQISTIPGYIMCADPSIDGNMLKSDRDEINSYLASGFFYE